MKRLLGRRGRGSQIIPGGFLVLLVIFAALLAPQISPRSPSTIDSGRQLESPSGGALFGTDNFGRDVFSRVIHGSRISLGIGLVSVFVATVIGSLLGLLAGYYGRWIDWGVMRVMDVLFSIPSILLALVLMGILGSSLTNLAIAISIVYMPIFARITRGEVLSLSSRDFIEASRSTGARDLHIMWRHLVPNVLPLLIIQMTINLAFAILAEASLSYLGLGTQPPAPSWGRMISEGRIYLGEAPWMSVFPGLALMLTVIGFNLLGDGLRDRLDPRLRE